MVLVIYNTATLKQVRLEVNLFGLFGSCDRPSKTLGTKRAIAWR
ncbi:hypothetical protein GXM_10004 [Nostoc sphaeroides CCNUC1]|uniref:Uncharacterized protein n=2 Tax=Nostoc sphaeroides TaxID=446679 RepID=A0A5P8WJI6_9NOSO|nr:hypothetical protein GXM_10004 [Nostoc sphaeroides CCNUC1]